MSFLILDELSLPALQIQNDTRKMKNYTLISLLKIFITVFCLSAISTVFCYAQSSPKESIPIKRHRIFLEMAGNGGFYSVNYERNITERFSARIGTELFPPAWTEEGETIAGFPLMLNYQVYRLGNHHLLAGIGTLLVTNGINSLTGTLTYELHVDNRAMLRLGFTPHYLDGEFEPWAGLGVGFIF